MLIDVIKQTPAEYSKQSRDYQVLARLYTALYNLSKMYIDDMSVWDRDIDNKLTMLRSKTLNFIPRHTWDEDELDAAVSCFKYLMFRKGTVAAIRYCVDILLRSKKLEGIVGPGDITIENGIVVIQVPEQIAGSGLLEDLFDYLLPAGILYRIIPFKTYDIGRTATDLFYHQAGSTEDIENAELGIYNGVYYHRDYEGFDPSKEPGPPFTNQGELWYKNEVTAWTPSDFFDLKLTKVWDDEQNADGKRPTKIELEVYLEDPDGSNKTLVRRIIVESQTANPDKPWDRWDYTVNNLLKYNNRKYIVEEKPIEFYDVTPEILYGEPESDGSVSVLIINHHIPSLDFDIKKEWYDFDDEDGLRPDNVEVNLYWKKAEDEQDTPKPVEGAGTVILNDSNNWSDNSTFINLKRYADDVGPEPYTDYGAEIKYLLVEQPIISSEGSYETGYDYVTTKVDTPERIFNLCNATIKNYHMPTIDIDVEKIWVDMAEEASEYLRPNSVDVDLYNKNDLTKPIETIELNPDQISGWVGTFSNVNKYNSYEKDEDDKYSIAEYTVKEKVAPTYYRSEVEETSEGSFTITNTLVEDITVKKIWDDFNNEDGSRPNNIKVKLVNGALYTGDELILNSNNNWTGTFKNVDRCEETSMGAQYIEYYIEEPEMSEYTRQRDLISETIDDSKINVNYTITNRHVPKIRIKVTKVWTGDEAFIDDRPEEVDVILYRNNSSEIIPISTITLNAQNNWQGEFIADKYDDENELIEDYMVKEIINLSSEASGTYESVISGDYIDGFIITNNYKVETINIEVTKVWTGPTSDVVDLGQVDYMVLKS